MPHIHIKFCGLKTQEDVNLCIKLNINFIGFVFYKKSPRFISIEEFSKLNLTNAPPVVAVFLEPSPQEVLAVVKSNRVDFLQIHNISAIQTKQLAIKTQKQIIAPIHNTHFTKETLNEYSFAEYLLFDSSTPGTGIERSFNFAKQIPQLTQKPFFLAGGINASNIASVTMLSNYVDLSSGIEEIKGIKNHKLMQDLAYSVNKINITTPKP